MALTDVRLEALTSAHQLESLKETINKMRSEMNSLRQSNDRLQKMMISRSLNSSLNSIPASDSADQRLSIAEEIFAASDSNDHLYECINKDEKRIKLTVFMGGHGEYEKYTRVSPADECAIGSIDINDEISWETLGNYVKQTFKEYLLWVDPVSNLGLSSESILTYHLGDITQEFDESNYPDILPFQYLSSENNKIRLVLKGASINCADALAFETLIDKSKIQKYISLLTEHRRILFCGPEGTGKTYLANKLAEHLVLRLGQDPSPSNIITFK